eukprot:CAMPEP_0204149562 /NCGR_PEP_ID=MMETSP0361-20130328/24503_1 /ASSEMBLY_ACC=CAM_ASM_000343 /TAXON_ID=268821 /ORGANISM="Scrippsiella Hangoei, Strain SHTV-5" /LENGTH=38 /DNA_ID= /DNA_START= /DNA_END= /DNA_ORIENTATION=
MALRPMELKGVNAEALDSQPELIDMELGLRTCILRLKR